VQSELRRRIDMRVFIAEFLLASILSCQILCGWTFTSWS
jgi:hypothetical protein